MTETRSKCGNRRTVVDGIAFDSAAEARRYQELRLLERAGEISGLELQPRYPLEVNEQLVTTYFADFRYLDHGIEVVEDVKGWRTPVYRLKKKFMKAVYGIEVREVPA